MTIGHGQGECDMNETKLAAGSISSVLIMNNSTWWVQQIIKPIKILVLFVTHLDYRLHGDHHMMRMESDCYSMNYELYKYNNTMHPSLTRDMCFTCCEFRHSFLQLYK